jgi:hypothetical protein
MAKRQLHPRLRHVIMQFALAGVFAAAVGLAAVVTHRVRMGLRLELQPAKAFGRLIARLPEKWAGTPVNVERGDCVEAEEPPSEQQAGRRLRIARQRTDGLISPIEHLVRSGQIRPDALKSLLDGKEGFARQSMNVAGWPGQMVTLSSSPRAGVVHKDLIACAVLPESQAVVVQLQGVGSVDASDRELIAQMAETLSLSQVPAAPQSGGMVQLVDDIRLEVPPRFVLVPNKHDPNQLGRQLLRDGSREEWMAIEVVSCVHFAGERDEAFLAMLAARDPDWRSTPVKRLSPNVLMVDRNDALAQNFPARAYLMNNPDGRALLVVLRGGLRDSASFDSAWQAISSSARFLGTKDLSPLLANGADAAVRIRSAGVQEWLEQDAARDWTTWDESENAWQERWMQMSWKLTQQQDALEVSGKRLSRPIDPYAGDTQYEQTWSASVDLSRYQSAVYREVHRPGSALPRQALEQRVSVEGGRMTLASTLGPSQADAQVPAQFVPGAILPLVLRELAHKPSLIRTESFIGVKSIAPPGLLTLFVTRLTDAPPRLDERDLPLDCVSVSVNGTGLVKRWYYSQDEGELKFIDYAGGVKAQSGRGR